MKNPCVLLAVALTLGMVGAAPAQSPAPAVIDVKVSGAETSGRPIVFVPGRASPGAVWDEAVARCAGEHPCYGVNIAGFGGLPPVRSEHLLNDVRDQIIAYIRARKLDKPLIVGHSLGGVVATDIAIHAPDLPGGLVSVDSVPFLAGLMMPGIDTEADAKKMAAGFGQTIGVQTRDQFAAGQKQFVGGMITSPEKAAAMAELTGKSDPATTGQAMTKLLGRDLRTEIAAIKCPTVVFVALADKVDGGLTREVIEQAYRRQYAKLPQTRFEIFERSRHFIMVDDPVGFDTALQKELDRL